ncbi:MAG TPA: ABC transporter permease [Sedimenticola thiotaurini]|uniref:ABC transporter permease n=1 Tax=Sedimenticola thiotaurini TaxID=1543721 RepID=A0A831RL23_9GAMM|nr:ABC transporter permease [Sedimenticola thiotaurini]
MLAIALKDLRGLFLSPLAWGLMAVMQLLLAWLFLVQLEGFLELQPRLAAMAGSPGVTGLVVVPLLDSAAVVLMLLVPLLGMGAFSREYSAGTLDLLLSSPVSIPRLVLGKYLALLTVIGLLWLLTALMPLSLLLGTRLDLGRLAAGLLGLGLAAAAYGAVALFFSSLTRQPAVAAVASYGLLLLLWLIDLAGGDLLPRLALGARYRHLLEGLVLSGDLIYFLLLILAALLLTMRRLGDRRLQG